MEFKTSLFFRCVLGLTMLLQSSGDSGAKPPDESRTPAHPDSDGTTTHILDYAPAPGWTVHANNEGRLYYCK